jgi:hypothetical protein
LELDGEFNSTKIILVEGEIDKQDYQRSLEFKASKVKEIEIKEEVDDIELPEPTKEEISISKKPHELEKYDSVRLEPNDAKPESDFFSGLKKIASGLFGGGKKKGLFKSSTEEEIDEESVKEEKEFKM